ncbi:unnamed protein product [marine sediment metagenome]|uniref:Uncharacterized protein n=1 Tax=marine sediment metagenome TaxID=412755 RepID=X1MUP9_9ZZZZ
MLCKECGGKIPTGQSELAWYCQQLGYCGYCYRMNYPIRRQVCSSTYWTEKMLSPSERLELEKNQFDGREQELWSKDFLEEWNDYIKAKERGELRC